MFHLYSSERSELTAGGLAVAAEGSGLRVYCICIKSSTQIHNSHFARIFKDKKSKKHFVRMKFVFIYDYLNESSIEPTIRMVQKKIHLHRSKSK